ncbi:MAG: 50S ribosomal protein L17 [Armatimonadota bacterium]
MRHRVAKRKLGLPSGQRIALLKNVVRSVVRHGKVRTTVTRAKEARVLVDKLVTLAKANDLHSRRQARRVLNDEALVKRLFDEVGPQYKDRPGGYTRIVRIGWRRGDAAPMALLELVEGE